MTGGAGRGAGGAGAEAAAGVAGIVGETSQADRDCWAGVGMVALEPGLAGAAAAAAVLDLGARVFSRTSRTFRSRSERREA